MSLMSKYVMWSKPLMIEGARIIIEIWGNARLCIDFHYKGDWLVLHEVSI